MSESRPQVRQDVDNYPCDAPSPDREAASKQRMDKPTRPSLSADLMTPNSSTEPIPIVIGLSGPSSSGKTTLARLLRDAYKPNAYILHQDDFYYTDEQIPYRNFDDRPKLQDWDCEEAIDWFQLRKTLEHIHQHCRIPRDHSSKEDTNSVGQVDVSSATLSRLREQAQNFLHDAQTALKKPAGAFNVFIIDGFLLFPPQLKEPVCGYFHRSLFLRADYATVKRRREARTGYATLEGFWEDPPGYVDDVVWPNYVRYHRRLCVDGDVGKAPDSGVCGRLRIEVQPESVMRSMDETLLWADTSLREAIGLQLAQSGWLDGLREQAGLNPGSELRRLIGTIEAKFGSDGSRSPLKIDGDPQVAFGSLPPSLTSPSEVFHR
ncbi:hypothetical protein LTS18_013849 [Coniosporium uncinatum]|uniref:Uncharacterized protein n=1 Tax=Coniosporium uncinatum TaxID=93489 RepID=A0ACC3DVX0_9PEZI|nr:hypothetical protein LTS18_013849 [Coniosporium uncinatum]